MRTYRVAHQWRRGAQHHHRADLRLTLNPAECFERAAARFSSLVRIPRQAHASASRPPMTPRDRSPESWLETHGRTTSLLEGQPDEITAHQPNTPTDELA